MALKRAFKNYPPVVSSSNINTVNSASAWHQLGIRFNRERRLKWTNAISVTGRQRTSSAGGSGVGAWCGKKSVEEEMED